MFGTSSGIFFPVHAGRRADPAGMHLPALPERPRGTSRLLVEVYFSAPAQCEIEVTDLGFGELYPSSDLCWKETFILEEQEEVSHGTGYGL